MSKKIIIQISRDGSIHAETKGIKGTSCMKCLKPLEKLMNARVVQKDLTSEYYDRDVEILEEQRYIYNRLDKGDE